MIYNSLELERNVKNIKNKNARTEGKLKDEIVKLEKEKMIGELKEKLLKKQETIKVQAEELHRMKLRDRKNVNYNEGSDVVLSEEKGDSGKISPKLKKKSKDGKQMFEEILNKKFNQIVNNDDYYKNLNNIIKKGGIVRSIDIIEMNDDYKDDLKKLNRNKLFGFGDMLEKYEVFSSNADIFIKGSRFKNKKTEKVEK